MIMELILKYFKQVTRINKNLITPSILISIPIISLFIGFMFNEDLSTGGSTWDFKVTWPIIVDYSNFNFLDADEFTRHMPLHYILLSYLNIIFDDPNVVRLIYLFFSLLLPIFLYLNLEKIYSYDKIHLLIFSFSFLFIPLFRAAAIWSNAHLTATIFFMIGNYFYLKSKEHHTYTYQLLNLLFLAFAIYSLQTYLILFLYYLYNYFLSEKISKFIKILFFCFFLSLPGLYFILLNTRIATQITITHDILYSLSTIFSIIFFFYLFLLFNKENFKILIKIIKKFRNIELFILLFISILIFYNQSIFTYDSRLMGGGFFYKLSYFIFNNNLIFITSSILGLALTYILIKYEPKILHIIIIISLMSLNYAVYQKYFEPLFLIMIGILFKNFLIGNILLNFKSTLIFYVTIFFYFLIAHINLFKNLSYNLVG
mgnify:CR=1 FL=1